METETYETATAYDALNRPTQMTTPDNGITEYTYDKGGLLKTVSVDNVHSLNTGIVNAITYDAKGQRQKIQYQNGATTTYEYDAFTFRVRNIKTIRGSDSKLLQGLQYWYDPVGNITLQKDGAQQPVYFDGTVADPQNDYTYDALYRLIQVEGRELAGNNNAPTYNDSSRIGITPIPIASTDTAKMRRYAQYYEYDAVGNFIQMRHTATGGTGNWTRNYTTDNNSNRLMSTVVGSGTSESYAYDNRGNIVSGFLHLQSMSYNAENHLEQVVINSTRTAYYQYDANGQRVRKTIVDTNSNTTEIRKYVGEWEVYRKLAGSSLNIERETLHIGDDTGRIALIDTRTQGSGAEPSQLLRYQYSNHLQSATLELDGTAAIISYEEYYPYGSTSFQSGRNSAEVSLKRYRYCAAERDEENGFYYFGARYYIPWLCRWFSSDPINSENYNIGKDYGLQKNKERDFLELAASSYEYCYDNPVRFNDVKGEQAPRNKHTTYNPHLPPSVSSDIEGVYALPQLKKYNFPTKKSDVDLEANSEVKSEKNNKGKKAIKKSLTIKDSVNKMMSDSETKLALENASRETGVSLENLMVMAMIESTGNKNVGTNKFGYTGLMQLGASAIKDIQKVDKTVTLENAKTSVEKNALGGAIYMKQHEKELVSKNISINVLHLYLAHQLGATGLYKMLQTIKTDPNAELTTGQKNNIPYHYYEQKGDDLTQQEFYEGWVNKIHVFDKAVKEYLKENGYSK